MPYIYLSHVFMQGTVASPKAFSSNKIANTMGMQQQIKYDYTCISKIVCILILWKIGEVRWIDWKSICIAKFLISIHLFELLFHQIFETKFYSMLHVHIKHRIKFSLENLIYVYNL